MSLNLLFFLCILHTQYSPAAQQTTFSLVNGGVTSISEVIGDIPVTVKTLVLTSNEITELNDGDFEQLVDCEYLHLGSNRIHTIASEAFRGLDNLEFLYLHFNELTRLPNLRLLPSLKELIIHSNKFSGFMPTLVQILPNNELEVLDIGYMEITFVRREFLNYFPNLKELRLCCNDLAELPGVSAISDHLEILDVTSNALNQMDPTFLKTNKPSALKVFRFGPTEIVQRVYVNQDFFRELPNLEEIYIESWGLTQIPDLSDNIAKLRKLTIKSNPDLEEIDSEMLFGDPPNYSQYAAMIELSLEDNGLTYISGDILAAMTNLRTLNLIGNDLTAFPMEDLQNLEDLHWISLESNELTTVCDIGHRENDLQIEITGNPLVCDTRLCWLFDSGYIHYDEERIGTQFSRFACEEPNRMTSVTWLEFNGEDIGCTGSSEPYGCTAPEPVWPDPGSDPGDNEDDGSPGDNENPEDPETSKNEDDSDIPLIPIAAGAVGGLTLILAVIIGVMICRRKSRKFVEEHESEPAPTSQQDNSVKDPNVIYISPDEKKSKEQKDIYESRKFDNKDYHVYTDIHGSTDNPMMRELSDRNEIRIQTAFYGKEK